MKRSYHFLVGITLVAVAFADSRIWPPKAFSLMSDGGASIVRFVPKIEGSAVVATRILSFSFEEKEARYGLVFDRDLPGFWEPSYVCAAKNPSVFVFVFFRPDQALAIVDCATKKVLLSKSFGELVPELFPVHYRDRSTSTLQWCGPPIKSGGKLFLFGGILDGDEAKRGPSFTVDLESYHIERQPE